MRYSLPTVERSTCLAYVSTVDVARHRQFVSSAKTCALVAFGFGIIDHETP